jgi:ribosomal-protein-alanine N-acetyltransferase
MDATFHDFVSIGEVMNGPKRVETNRLVLRKPSMADAEAIFARYAADVEVTRYVGWPRHQSVEETRAFLCFSDSEWRRWPAGPYLIESRLDQQLLGGTGFGFESRSVAMIGYVLARDSWGRGYATEALMAIIDIARELKILQLYALCHPDNTASIRVLEKCDFLLEQRLEQFLQFPNLTPNNREDCLRYVLRSDVGLSAG